MTAAYLRVFPHVSHFAYLFHFRRPDKLFNLRNVLLINTINKL